MNLFRRIRQSISSSSPMTTKRILLLSSLRHGSGNSATAERIAYELELSNKFLVDCLSVDAPQTELNSLSTCIRQYAAVLALHVYRTGLILSSIYKDGENDLPPLILIFAGTDLHSCEPKWIPTMEYIIPRAKGLVCFNHEWKKHVETTYHNLLPCKITVIPQAVLLSPFIFEEMPISIEKKIILWVGEIRAVKDPIFAMRFLSHLNNNNYQLFLIGQQTDSTLSEYIRSTYSRLNFTFLGVQSQSFVHTFMQTAFAYLNTSINEGMCLTILEAMTLGVPVLARRNSGNTSLIKHGKTGLLFDTPDEAVQCLIELDNSTKLRYSLVRQGEDYVRKTHLLAMESKSYRNLLSNLMK